MKKYIIMLLLSICIVSCSRKVEYYESDGYFCSYQNNDRSSDTFLFKSAKGNLIPFDSNNLIKANYSPIQIKYYSENHIPIHLKCEIVEEVILQDEVNITSIEELHK